MNQPKNNGFVPIGGVRHGITSNRGRGLIHLSQIESGDTLWLTLQDLIDAVKRLNPDIFRKKTELIYEKDLDPRLLNKIDSAEKFDDTYLRNEIANLKTFKADKEELDFYRLKSVSIEVADLSQELQDIIFAFTNNGYDDRWIKEDIALLKAIKMDKTDEILFRKVNDQIIFDDLDENIQSLLETISDNASSITELQETKANRNELENYRHKAITITYNDLDDHVQNLLDNFVPYDDTVVKANIIQLENKKADRTELDKKADASLLSLYREKAVNITFEDLDDHLKEILDDIPADFDPLQLQIQINSLNERKADRSELDNYRSKAELIKDVDLTPALLDKINASDNPYDDQPVWTAINELESSKVDYVTLSGYLKDEDESVTMSNLHKDVQLVLQNKVGRGELDFYRHIDVKIEENDLSEEVKVKLNKDQDGLNALEARVGTLETKQEQNEETFEEIDNTISEIHEELERKSDHVYAEDTYRKKTDLIFEDNLDIELQNKINSIPNQENLSNLQNKVQYLEKELPKKASNDDLDALKQEVINARGGEDTLVDKMNKKLEKEQADALYRSLNANITTNDLAADVLAKLNKATDDHTKLLNKNSEEEYQHITSLERTKFNEYENIISGLIDRIINLELHTGLQAEPMIISSSVDGMLEVPVNIGKIEYQVSGEDLSIANSSLITMSPNRIIGTPTLDGNTLTIDLAPLDEKTYYNINIGTGALKNGDILNKKLYTTQFITEEVNKAPVVKNSRLHGRIDVSVNTDEVLFNVECNNDVTLADAGLITMRPNVIDGEITLENKVLRIPVSNLVESTTYMITIPEGVVEGNGKVNNVQLVDVFTTEDVKTKPVIGNSTLNGRQDVPVSTSEIRFPVTAEEEIVLVNADLITCNEDVLGTVRVEGSDLVIPFTGLDYETEYTITIGEGAIQNGDDLFNDEKVNTFSTEIEQTKPVIKDINGYANSHDVPYDATELVFEIEHKKTLKVGDLSQITMLPNAINETPRIEGDNLIIPVELTQLSDYELIIPEGLIQDGNSLFNDRLTMEFRTNKKLTEPFIMDCQLHNKTDVSLKTTKAIFPVLVTESLVIENDALITVEPNAKIARSQVVGGKLEVLLGNLEPLTEYTITIGAGALKDGSMLPNSKPKVNRFTTERGNVPPVVLDCNLNGQTDVPLETSKVIFPIESEVEVTVANESKITSSPNVKLGNSRISGNNLEVTITGLKEATEYTVTVEAGALRDANGLENETSKVNTFTTIDIKTKPVIHDCELNDEDNVPLTTDKIEFLVECSESIVLADKSKVKISPEVEIGEVVIEENKLVVPVSELKETTLYTITLEEGLLQDGDDLFNDELVNTFITEDVKTAPVIHDCELNGRDDVDAASLTKIEFLVECDESIELVDESLITIEPNILSAEITVEDDKLVLPVANAEYETEYTVTIGKGAIQNGDDLMNTEVINTFTTKTQPREDGVEWEYVKTIHNIATSVITYKEIEDAVGVKLDPDGLDFYLDDPEVDPDADISANPKVVIEYWGPAEGDLEEGVRIPRDGIDDGGDCPLIPMPSYKPTTVEFYTLGASIPDTGKVLFTSTAAYPHLIKVRKYIK